MALTRGLEQQLQELLQVGLEQQQLGAVAGQGEGSRKHKQTTMSEGSMMAEMVDYLAGITTIRVTS